MTSKLNTDFIIRAIKNDYSNIDLFSCIKYCQSLYETRETRQECYDIVAILLESWDIIPKLDKEIWTDLIESLGLYPYLEKKELSLSLSWSIRKLFYKSNHLKDIFFHDEQRTILSLLEDKNIVLSAPTSFGKSLLIEELVASRKYKNIIIIQPTLALLDETRKKLKFYKNEYKLILRTNQKIDENKWNIFLFTAERVIEFEVFPHIDLLIIDEFYKISWKRKDERSISLNQAFYTVIKKFNPRFFFLWPNIDGISSGFEEKYSAYFIKATYSPVKTYEVDCIVEKWLRNQKLFELLDNLKSEQVLVYCSSPEQSQKLSKLYLNHLIQKWNIPNKELDILDWIEDNFWSDWSLSDILSHGIWFHHRGLPRHISSSIIEYFNYWNINVLFCTATIIEWVNTSAKHIIFFNKGRVNSWRTLDVFDYKNIRWRAWRFMKHFSWSVYNFEIPPTWAETMLVDFPIFEQDWISSDLYNYLDKNDVKNINSSEYQNVVQTPEDIRELIKKNWLSFDWQKSLIKDLEQNTLEHYSQLKWKNTPKYNELLYLLELANKHLNFHENKRVSIKSIAFRTSTYPFKTIPEIIKERVLFLSENNEIWLSKSEIKDKAIYELFDLIRNYFEYKIPKVLSVMDSLQKYVFWKKWLETWDYSKFILLLEWWWVGESYILLEEQGVPKSAIDKISKKLWKEISEEHLLSELENNIDENLYGLIPYEMGKLRWVIL